MKGRVEIIRELLGAKPNSIHEKLSTGETVLHLCVKYNKLEALKTLVRYVQSNDMESLLNSRDDDGNTILHLAVALKQMDTIEYLLGIKSVKDHANVRNHHGSTTLDLVGNCRFEAGCISRFWTKYIKVDPVWLHEVRGHLITAATLTATMAYQSILSPPGGLWQENKDGHVAGKAILDGAAGDDEWTYAYYFAVNSIVLIASLSTIILAMAGFPIRNKLVTWLLIFTVFVTLLCMGKAYFAAMDLVSPKLKETLSQKALIGMHFGWQCLVYFVLLIPSCRFLEWLGNKLVKLVKACYRCCVPRATRNNISTSEVNPAGRP